MMKRNRSNETTQLLAGIFAVSALACVAVLIATAAVLVLPFAMLGVCGWLLCWAVWSAVTAGRVEQSARTASELGQAVLNDVAWTVATAEHATSRAAVWAAGPVCNLFGKLWFAALDYLVGPAPTTALAGGDVGDYPAVGGVEYPAGVEEGQHALLSVEQPEQAEAESDAVEQDLVSQLLNPAAVWTVQTAICTRNEDGSITVSHVTNETTTLDPVEDLNFVPASTPAADCVEQPEPDAVLPEGKDAVDAARYGPADLEPEQPHGCQPAPGTQTGDAALDKVLALIASGKSVREAARLLGIPASTLRGRLNRWKMRRPQTAAA